MLLRQNRDISISQQKHDTSKILDNGITQTRKYDAPSSLTSAKTPGEFGKSSQFEDVDLELNLQPSKSMLQQTDTSYLNSRVEAVTNIEKHIQELSGIFSRFSELVAQSEHSVARIDDNVNLAEERLMLGRDELLRYWRNNQGNFWLMLKVSFVLRFFLTFFIVFVL